MGIINKIRILFQENMLVNLAILVKTVIIIVEGHLKNLVNPTEDNNKAKIVLSIKISK
jgi:hypothetical protein